MVTNSEKGNSTYSPKMLVLKEINYTQGLNISTSVDKVNDIMAMIVSICRAVRD
jgi:hypothetical protein